MQPSLTILFADRSPEKQSGCLALFEEYPSSNIHFCSKKEELIIDIDSLRPDILFLDVLLWPEQEGLTTLDNIREKYSQLLVIAVIPHDAPHLEQEIIKRDLFFYVTTPYEATEIQLALKRATTKLNLIPPAQKKSASKRLPPFYGIIGETKVMQNLFSLIKKVANDDLATVLVRGESGTGKELVAKAIHQHSNRKDNHFVPVNCAAIPDDLLESELFGYTKGAFTGAVHNKTGRIQYAHKGTLFLDEIGDMKPSLQAKLLRVLQEKEFEPVGSLKATPVDTRIVAATHCDLEMLVSDGKFREDLYYRISVIPLSIPPLKDRKEDIPILIDSFMRLHATHRGREKFTIPMPVMAALLTYDWRGNVRELENLVQQLAILSGGQEVQLTDLPERIIQDFNPKEVDHKKIESILALVAEDGIIHNTDQKSSKSIIPSVSSWEDGQVDFKKLINDYESQLIIKAMKMTDGNKKEAAKLLNLKRTTLLEKIKKKELQGMWD